MVGPVLVPRNEAPTSGKVRGMDGYAEVATRWSWFAKKQAPRCGGQLELGTNHLRAGDTDATAANEYDIHGAKALFTHGEGPHLQGATQHARMAKRSKGHVVGQRLICGNAHIGCRMFEVQYYIFAIHFTFVASVDVDEESLGPGAGINALDPVRRLAQVNAMSALDGLRSSKLHAFSE